VLSNEDPTRVSAPSIPPSFTIASISAPAPRIEDSRLQFSNSFWGRVLMFWYGGCHGNYVRRTGQSPELLSFGEFDDAPIGTIKVGASSSTSLALYVVQTWLRKGD
jgi:hypothetical protein